MGIRSRFWKAVRCAADMTECPDCSEPWCVVCDYHYADCSCPGPTQDDLYDYKTIDGELYAKEKLCPDS